MVLNALMLTLMAAILISCLGIVPYGPSVVIGKLTLPPGRTGYVTIHINSLNDLQSFQVGPNGKFIFNPQVVRLRAIEGINGFQLFASKIDNEKGEALFLIGYPGGSKSDDGIVRIEVEAVGRVGAISTLEITAIDVLADSKGNDIINYKIYNGSIRIEWEKRF
jgi:hypothetical protein